jgi:uncharacterized protein YabN with tetrapyrrole methylase and pyrophosphatase domain
MIQKKVAKVGFDWKELGPLWEKLHEETNELKEALDTGHYESYEMELGDLLFTVINIARMLKVNPAIALDATNRKFVRRFRILETEMGQRRVPLHHDHLETMDSIWNEIKKAEKNKPG